MEIKIKLLNSEAKLPDYAHPGDAGLDLLALEDITLMPQEIRRIDFGFALELPKGYMALMMDKGGIGSKGIHNLGGVFDAGYRGEYNCTLINLSRETMEFKKSQKVCQLVIYPIVGAELKITDQLDETSRGDGRFGSTGQ